MNWISEHNRVNSKKIEQISNRALHSFNPIDLTNDDNRTNQQRQFSGLTKTIEQINEDNGTD